MSSLLFKGGRVVDVFTDELMAADVLVEDGVIVGVGDYDTADTVIDVAGKIVCPGLIDGHIHIESSMMLPDEFVRAVLPHGTTGVFCDPHEIANVCGTDGIDYMLRATEGLPLDVYVMLPSCVPASPMEESGAVLTAADLRPFYSHPRVRGLAEMMDFPGVLNHNPDIMQKIADAEAAGRCVDGHAPLVTGHALDAYVAAGIDSDHECTSADEAIGRVRLGQWVMLRQGTVTRDLPALMPLLDEPYNRRCLLSTDDKHPADILKNGHLDNHIRMAVAAGKNPLAAIRVGSLQAAQRFGLRYVGAVAPHYAADLLVLDDLDTMQVAQVYKRGRLVAEHGEALPFARPAVSQELFDRVSNTFHMEQLKPEMFAVTPQGSRCRVTQLHVGQVLTTERIEPVVWDERNGVNLDADIVKFAVVERHHNTGHIGLGYLGGYGLRGGAVASSVAHDAHNLIIAGTNDADMALAGNTVREQHGGWAIVKDGVVLGALPLPVAGLMAPLSAEELSRRMSDMRELSVTLGVTEGIDAYMSLAFVSLSVIPALKLTTKGLFDVNKQQLVPLTLN